jgi:hypothetical protein
MTAREVQEHVQSLGSPEATVQAARFFKSAPGQYGAGSQRYTMRLMGTRRELFCRRLENMHARHICYLAREGMRSNV